MVSFPPILLCGATAVGKSAVGLVLAQKLGGEIISVDSMQVYRGLNIGTAKPTTTEQKTVPHHLIDIVELSDSFDAAKFVSRTKAAIEEIQSRRRIPILCGGTGLYFSAWCGGLGESPAPDVKLRFELEAAPMEVLLAELAQMDSATFNEIDLQNRRRVVRAVEVIRLTGKPFSTQRAQWAEVSAEIQGRCMGLSRSRDELCQRIDSRVDSMFQAGLVDETRILLGLGLRENRTAMQAIGYRQVAEHIDGQRGHREAVELIKVKTRQFAKRQSTWFRRKMDLDWLEIPRLETPEMTAHRIEDKLRQTLT